MIDETHITNSAQQTKKIGANIAGKLKKGDVLVFFGNLGSGKTTFIQGLAKGLGIERRIISPTFIFIRLYRIKIGSFYHIDLYRVGSVHDLLGLGIDEIFREKNNIVAIEWGEKLGELLPKKRIEIHCVYLNDSQRKIIVKQYE